MKRLLFILCFYLITKLVDAQDTTYYPFHREYYTNFAQALEGFGNEWMSTDKGCSSGLYFVEIWFDKISKKVNLFVPDNIPRQFADSIRKLFAESAIMWDTSAMAKLTTTFVQPILIEDIECDKNINSAKRSNKSDQDLYLIKYSALQKSIEAFFEKLSYNPNPRRYYFLEPAYINEPKRKKRWSM